MRAAATRRRAFTLIELLVVIAVITILASLLMPTVMSAMRQAGSAQCKSNLGQTGKSSMIYANQYAQFLPCYGWYANPADGDGNRHRRNALMLAPQELILPYIDDSAVYLCPADPTPTNCRWWCLDHPSMTDCSQMWNEHIITHPIDPLPNYRNPHEIGVVADGWMCLNGWTWVTCAPAGFYQYSRIDWEHDGSVNVLYADQHVARVAHYDLDDVRSDPK